MASQLENALYRRTYDRDDYEREYIHEWEDIYSTFDVETSTFHERCGLCEKLAQLSERYGFVPFDNDDEIYS